MSCGVGRRRGSNPVWLWLWPAAVAPIRSLAWEPPYATGAVLKSRTKTKTKKTGFVNQTAWISLVILPLTV